MLLSTSSAVRVASRRVLAETGKNAAARSTGAATISVSAPFSSLTNVTTNNNSTTSFMCSPCAPHSKMCTCADCRTVGMASTMTKRTFLANPQEEASPVEESIDISFPKAKTNAELVSSITTSLAKYGFTKDNSLVATSFCADEVNRVLEKDLAEAYDMPNFSMGGLAGFPFGGVTSFGAMASHIPDGGSCLVVFGPHVGVDSTGAVGTVERQGRAAGGACCGSAVAASGYVSTVYTGSAQEAGLPDSPLDAQQNFVGSMLLPYAEQLEKADNKMVDLPYALYAAQKKMMSDIVSAGAGAVGGDGKIAVLGGIQINTPPTEDSSDYFLPLSFEVYGNDGKLIEDMSGEIDCGTLPAGI